MAIGLLRAEGQLLIYRTYAVVGFGRRSRPNQREKREVWRGCDPPNLPENVDCGSPVIYTSYAVPARGHSQRYFSFRMYVVFALAERKNDVRKNGSTLLPQAKRRLRARPRNSCYLDQGRRTNEQHPLGCSSGVLGRTMGKSRASHSRRRRGERPTDRRPGASTHGAARPAKRPGRRS